jgi:hypothetical protein
MIVTVTLNPAIDVTYRLPRLTVGEVHRVAEVTTRLGGKGVNLARVLHQLGEPTHAIGLADHDFAAALASELPSTFLPELEEVRRAVVVVAESTTSLWEPGRQAAPGADQRLPDELVTACAGWFAKIEHSLHVHHKVEDEIMWPAMCRRDAAFAADQALMESGYRTSRRKQMVDAVAASLILQSYLDSQR